MNFQENQVKTSNSIELFRIDKKSLEQENHSPFYDEAKGFPPTPKEKVLHWSKFDMNIYSDEVDATYVLENIVD